MPDSAIFPAVARPQGETERAHQPVDGGTRVGIQQAGDYLRVRGPRIGPACNRGYLALWGASCAQSRRLDTRVRCDLAGQGDALIRPPGVLR